MKDQLKTLVQRAIDDLSFPSLPVALTRPEDSRFGDYTTNIAFLLGKQLKQNPRAIATQLATYLENQKQSILNSNASKKQNELTILRDISAITIAGSGFINFTVTPSEFSRKIAEVLKEKQAYGSSKNKKKEKVVVEYTDPNPFKTLHIGHLYSNAVGESLARLLETKSSDVYRVCYQGDVGLHVAKALWGMLESIKRQASLINQKFSGQATIREVLDEYKNKSLQDRVTWLGEAYALGSTAYEDDESAKEEMKQMNIMAFIAAQQMHEKLGVHPVIDYKRLLTVNSSANSFAQEDISLLFQTGRSWSLDYFETQYKRLGTHFLGYYFESMVAETGYEIVKKNITNGIFEESDGAIIYKGEKKGLHTRVFINKLGLPTYEAKELGLAPKKFEDWHYDRSIIITAKEIDEYFKVLLAALGEINPELAKKTLHMSHGIVKLPEGKMSSRKGNVLTAEWLLDETKASIAALIDQNGSYSAKEKEEIAEKATVAAVKYSLLKVSLPSDISFDIKKSVSMEGDSGPYLLYTYARCRSIERKSKAASSVKQQASNIPGLTPESSFNSEEHTLARLMLYFPEIVAEATEALSPSTIARYLIDLAQSFNVFYAKHHILEASSDKPQSSKEEAHLQEVLTPEVSQFRQTLTAATAQVLHNGLHLLGIETVERM